MTDHTPSWPAGEWVGKDVWWKDPELTKAKPFMCEVRAENGDFIKIRVLRGNRLKDAWVKKSEVMIGGKR